METLDKVLTFIEKWGVGLCLALCLICLNLSVITRYAFQRPLSWPDELSTYLFILMIFLGASASVKTRSELVVNALAERFPEWLRGLDLFQHLVRFAAAAVITWTGINFVQVEWEMATYSPILQIPIFLVFCMLPLFGVMLMLRTVLRLRGLWRGE
ncbi:MAG: TRAP transporter small permease [Deltaproteobacteria bacterium]|nr:TRAP transporter small permease [Deltaproteobacteria bacterium]